VLKGLAARVIVVVAALGAHVSRNCPQSYSSTTVIQLVPRSEDFCVRWQLVGNWPHIKGTRCGQTCIRCTSRCCACCLGMSCRSCLDLFHKVHAVGRLHACLMADMFWHVLMADICFCVGVDWAAGIEVVCADQWPAGSCCRCSRCKSLPWCGNLAAGYGCGIPLVGRALGFVSVVSLSCFSPGVPSAHPCWMRVEEADVSYGVEFTSHYRLLVSQVGLLYGTACCCCASGRTVWANTPLFSSASSRCVGCSCRQGGWCGGCQV